MDLKNSPQAEQTSREPTEPAGRSPVALIAVAGLAALCCGAPLLFAALAAMGGAGWFIAHGSLLAVPAVALAGGLLWWRSRRGRAGKAGP